jgi:hypothetical protein
MGFNRLNDNNYDNDNIDIVDTLGVNEKSSEY